MHEAGYEYALVLLPNAFIASLCFPRITTYLLGFYALARFNHINAYTGSRGYSGAVIHEELIRFYLILMLGTAFFSAFKLTFGIGPIQPMSRIRGRIGAFRKKRSGGKL